ncbi:hypothetical protein D3C71_1755710 [compost metagenome]
MQLRRDESQHFEQACATEIALDAELGVARRYPVQYRDVFADNISVVQDECWHISFRVDLREIVTRGSDFCLQVDTFDLEHGTCFSESDMIRKAACAWIVVKSQGTLLFVMCKSDH